MTECLRKGNTPQNFYWKSDLVVTKNADLFYYREIYSEI